MASNSVFIPPSTISACDSFLPNHASSNFHRHWSAPLREINQRCIELMIAAINHIDNNDNIDLFHALSAQMTTLTPAAIERLASHPFLLANIQFQDEPWWRTTAVQPDRHWHTTVVFMHVSRAAVIRLARAALVFVWHATRTYHDYAIVLLGIKPSVLEIIASLRLHDIDEIAERQFEHLAPRWYDQPNVWRQLLDDAIHMGIITQINCNLRSLQLFAGQYITTDHHVKE